MAREETFTAQLIRLHPWGPGLVVFGLALAARAWHVFPVGSKPTQLVVGGWIIGLLTAATGVTVTHRAMLRLKAARRAGV